MANKILGDSDPIARVQADGVAIAHKNLKIGPNSICLTMSKKWNVHAKTRTTDN